MLKKIIDKLTSIYNEYGDLDVIKNDECGAYFDVTPERISVVDFFDKEGNIDKTVEL